MMKRFSRKRRGEGGNKAAAIDVNEWLPKIAGQGIVETESLEAWPDAGVPDTVAAIGKGARADGSAVLVAFSPNSATEAMIGGLAAAQQAVEADSFAGELLMNIGITFVPIETSARRVDQLITGLFFALGPLGVVLAVRDEATHIRNRLCAVCAWCACASFGWPARALMANLSAPARLA